jgi:FkbM family methyltransferase
LASRYFAAAFPGVRLLAVEPDDSNHELLLKNLEVVCSGSCKVVKGAVWGKSANLAISQVVAERYNSVRVSSEATDQCSQTRGYPMDELVKLAGFPRVDLLKVDIEGAETELFTANLEWLKRVRAIAIEFHGNSREESGFDSIMSDYGFSIVDEGSHTVVALASRPYEAT